MAAGPTISRQKIMAASKGEASMQEVLEQFAAAISQQQSVTGTTPTAGTTAGKSNPAAPVPGQSTGTVSLLNKTYIVQLVNPGGSSPSSQLQAQQAAGSASPLTSLQPVTPIYHQIRASTSPAFNVNSNTQTFGGNTGSTQMYWTLTGLGSGTWYVQFRSSFDGVNWNKWKNANGGTALGKLVNEVTIESPGNSTWAVFTLPGSLIMGIGAAVLADQGIFNLAAEVYSSGMLAIAGPNGFSGQGNGISGYTKAEVDLQAGGTGAVSGVPDLPVEIRMQMAIAQTSTTFAANANVFAIAFDPTNPNVRLYATGTAIWAAFRLPGGARFAVGQGKTMDGSDIAIPSALAWIDASRMLSICSLTDVTLGGQPITGINQAQLTGLTANGSYLDSHGAPVAGQNVNWLAFAWELGTDVVTAAGNSFLEIQLQGGHALVIGAGQSASGSPITLPAGYTAENTLSIATPGGSEDTGHHLRGVQECAVFGLTPILVYTDNANTWGGVLNWLMACWK